MDSFSQWSLATALLKQEAERSMGAYVQNRDQDSAANLIPQQARTADQQISELNHARMAQPEAGALKVSPIRDLEKLHGQIRELDADLDRKLMVVYFQNHLWNEFLDRYLHLLSTEPESSAVVNWAWSALVCSQECRRTEEVLDELQHLIQFQHGLKSARGLKATSDEWRSKHPSSSAQIDPVVSSVRPLAATPSSRGF